MPASIGQFFSEISEVRGLIPLLIRSRNSRCWSPEERAALTMHLQRLTNISPYLLVLALPGSFVLLPALAWWLARRRNHQLPSQAPQE